MRTGGAVGGEAFDPEEQRLSNEDDFYCACQRRMLVHAVEGFIFTCRELTLLTGESLVDQATSSDDLVARLRADEENLIETFGPPWRREQPVVDSPTLQLQP